MPENLKLVIGGDNSAGMRALTETRRELLAIGGAGEQAAAGVNATANRLAALDEAQRRGRGSAAELAASHHQAAAAARELAGGVGGVNARLVALKSAGEQARVVTGELDAIAGGALRVEAALLAVGGAAAVAFGAQSVRAYAQREADIKGLATVSRDAAAEMAQLVQQDKQPGASLEGGLAMVRGLEAAEVTAERAHQAVDATAKALSRIGKSSSEMREVGFILQQGASMPQVSGDVFRQLAYRFPETKKVMKAAFGSVDPEYIGQLAMSGREAIERYIAAWDELEGVGASTANRIENIGIAWQEAQVAFGRGLVGPGTTEGMEELADSVDRLAPELEELGRTWGGVLATGLEVTAWLLDDGPWQKSIRGTVALTAATVALTAATALYYSLRARAGLLAATGVLPGVGPGGMIAGFGSGGLRGALGGLFGGGAGAATAGAAGVTAATEAAAAAGAANGLRAPLTAAQIAAGGAGSVAQAAIARMGWDKSIKAARAVGGEEGVAKFVAAARGAEAASVGAARGAGLFATGLGTVAVVAGSLIAGYKLAEWASGAGKAFKEEAAAAEAAAEAERDLADLRQRRLGQYGAASLPGEDPGVAERLKNQAQEAAKRLADAERQRSELERETGSRFANPLGRPWAQYDEGPKWAQGTAYADWHKRYEQAKADEDKAREDYQKVEPELRRRYEQTREQAKQIENYKVLADLAAARAKYEEAALGSLRATAAPAGELAAAWEKLDKAQQEGWKQRLEQAKAEDKLHPEMKILAKVELEIDTEKLQQALRRAQDDLLRYRSMSPEQIAADRSRQGTDPGIARWQDLNLSQFHGEREAGLATGRGRVLAGREAMERAGGNRWDELQRIRAAEDAQTRASWGPRLQAAQARSELERDPSIVARERLAIEAESYELAARRMGEEREHVRKVAGWEEGLAGAQAAAAKTQLDIAMARRRPAEEIAAIEKQVLAASEREMAKRMRVAELQVASGENLLAVDQERTRQAAEREQIDQASYQRRMELRERELGWAAGLAGAQQGYAEARMGHAQAFGRPARELLGLQDQIDAKRHAAQQIQLQQAAQEVATRKDIYALAKARLQIAGEELQAAQARRQIELQAAQHQVNLAGTAAGLAQQRYQQTMTLFEDPRMRMLAGLNLGDVRAAQQNARAEQERAWAQQLELARARGPEAEAEARAQIGALQEQARFQEMMDDRRLMRNRWLMGFTSAGGTPMAMGTGETGFASALIGGDQGRIADILQAAHRQSLRPLQMLNDGLGALRKPDVTGLREGVLGALRERDAEFLREFVAAVRG